MFPVLTDIKTNDQWNLKILNETKLQLNSLKYPDEKF